MHSPTLTVPCPRKVGRVLTCVTRLADQAGIWARTSRGRSGETHKELFGTVTGSTHIVCPMFLSQEMKFPRRTARLLPALWLLHKEKRENEPDADMKRPLLVQVLAGDKAGAGSSWHGGVAGGRTYMGRHSRVQITRGWLTCCKPCHLYLTSVSLIPLFLFLFIGILFLLWGGEIDRWLKTVRACFSQHVDCCKVLAAQ